MSISLGGVGGKELKTMQTRQKNNSRSSTKEEGGSEDGGGVSIGGKGHFIGGAGKKFFTWLKSRRHGK